MPLSPFLDVETPITFKDQPGIQSAVFYTYIPLCNLECFQCHNKLSFDGRSGFISYEKLDNKLNQLKLLGVELIIISGGEPTLEKRLEEGLKFIKEKGFPVRIDTNGTVPGKIEELIRNKMVDGFALDVKIPIKNVYSDEEKERFKQILFSNKLENDEKMFWYVENLKKSVEKIKKFAKKKPLPLENYSQLTILRTVRYPLLTEKDIADIKAFAEATGIPHQLNSFYSVEA
ncbi:radical SAM protein [Desulfurobacterium indicum]|uniref:Radical SAM protein n=1 Tax=Desulfurobacterium indicum TaxID=1914305 RepID=A0A1R1MLM4_9BACT|nr:radical SAM protein [Desulfurobacterium indicum]OMH40711.1 radical SAM protein [Desulfurobacterium indicum]